MTTQDAIDRILDPKQKVICQNEFDVFGIVGDDERAIFKTIVENGTFGFYLLTEQELLETPTEELLLRVGAACYNAQRRADEPPAAEADPERVRRYGSMVLEGWKGPIFSQDTVGAPDNWRLYCFRVAPERVDAAPDETTEEQL